MVSLSQVSRSQDSEAVYGANKSPVGNGLFSNGTNNIYNLFKIIPICMLFNTTAIITFHNLILTDLL